MLFGAAYALRQSIGVPLRGADRDDCEAQMAIARSALGDAAFDEAWALGGIMTTDQAVEEARAALP